MSQCYFKEKDVIRHIMDFNYAGSTCSELLNISYGVDRNFLYGCGISIASILLSNQDTSLTFHVFTDYFSDDDQEKFSALARQYHSRIIVYLIDCERLKSLPSTKNWTYAMYFRFIIADYFSGKIDKVLYLDADIACQASIKELIDLDFNTDEIAAVVAEGDITWWRKRSVSLATPGLINGYFNSGVLLMHIPAWNAASISRRAIEMLNSSEIINKISHMDQDALNILLTGKIHFLDKKFNTQYSINYELSGKVKNPVNENTVLIHYIGPTKPWHCWGEYPVSASFLRAKNASPWVSETLLFPSNSNQYRYCAKHQWHNRKIFSAILAYFNYFCLKLYKK